VEAGVTDLAVEEDLVVLEVAILAEVVQEVVGRNLIIKLCDFFV
jgi:hypothetical protein